MKIPTLKKNLKATITTEIKFGCSPPAEKRKRHGKGVCQVGKNRKAGKKKYGVRQAR